MLGLAARQVLSRWKPKALLRRPQPQQLESRPSLASRSLKKFAISQKCYRRYTTETERIPETVTTVQAATSSKPRSSAPRSGYSRYAQAYESMYSADRVHLLPESPFLWMAGVVARENFLTFLNDYLRQRYWRGAAQLYAQLVYQTHHINHTVSTETTSEILRDRLPALPLPELSQVELFGVFTALRGKGLYQHALSLWKYFDTESHHGKPLLKPHNHYYSTAFEKAYTLHSDVRTVQLLTSVLETADMVGDTHLVHSVFERLVGGIIADIKLIQVSKSEIPRTPLWHVSYIRQLRALEIGLRNLNPKHDAEQIVAYINTFRLKFATCWTPSFALHLYSLLATCAKENSSISERATEVENQIKKIAYKIAIHGTLQAIRNDECWKRIQESQPYINIDQTNINAQKKSINDASIDAKANLDDPVSENPNNVNHPGLVNIIAHIQDLQQLDKPESYQIIKQLFLECFEVPYFFEEPHSILEPTLKHFVSGDDISAISWLYQKCIEENWTLSVNARNLLMHWAIRRREDPIMCIEFFNDLQVALGPQAANGATIYLLFEAIQARDDLDAAMNALEYTREHIKSWAIFKHILESTLNLALNKQDEKILQFLSDEMSVKLPNTYNERWRGRLVEFFKGRESTYTPPVVVSTNTAQYL